MNTHSLVPNYGISARQCYEPIRVLIVDDHINLISNVFAYLENKNFILDAARDGESALELSSNGQYDVLILDWMLPRLNGLQVLQRLRAADVDTPTLDPHCQE